MITVSDIFLSRQSSISAFTVNLWSSRNYISRNDEITLS